MPQTKYFKITSIVVAVIVLIFLSLLYFTTTTFGKDSQFNTIFEKLNFENNSYFKSFIPDANTLVKNIQGDIPSSFKSPNTLQISTNKSVDGKIYQVQSDSNLSEDKKFIISQFFIKNTQDETDIRNFEAIKNLESGQVLFKLDGSFTSLIKSKLESKYLNADNKLSRVAFDSLINDKQSEFSTKYFELTTGDLADLNLSNFVNFDDINYIQNVSTSLDVFDNTSFDAIINSSQSKYLDRDFSELPSSINVETVSDDIPTLNIYKSKNTSIENLTETDIQNLTNTFFKATYHHKINYQTGKHVSTTLQIQITKENYNIGLLDKAPNDDSQAGEKVGIKLESYQADYKNRFDNAAKELWNKSYRFKKVLTDFNLDNLSEYKVIDYQYTSKEELQNSIYSYLILYGIDHLEYVKESTIFVFDNQTESDNFINSLIAKLKSIGLVYGRSIYPANPTQEYLSVSKQMVIRYDVEQIGNAGRYQVTVTYRDTAD